MPDRSRQAVPTTAAVTVTAVGDLATLACHHEEWSELAGRALEPNVFYEPDMLLPALRDLAPAPGWRVLLIRQEGRLIGLVPLQRYALGRISTGLMLELLRYRHSFLHVPLIDADAATAALDGLLAWFARSGGPALLLCRRLTVAGPFCRLLRERATGQGMPVRESRLYSRPALIPAGDAEAYLGRALGGDRRRELRRQRRLLEALGQVESHWVAPGQSPAAWLDGFLALEAQGWKGDNRSAIASRAQQVPFFRGAVAALHARSRALLGGLTLDGRWIAMNCSLRAAGAHGGAFAFKTTYDESLRRFAPGLLMEVEFIRRMFADSGGVPWLDSCCGPDNAVIARLWSDRRPIGDLTLAAAGAKGRAGLWAQERALAWRARRQGFDAGDDKMDA
jgi:CelD/BcsL family acetyltransferase involved in cellulose biosynthesis